MATVTDLISFLSNVNDIHDAEGLRADDAPIDSVEELISDFDEEQKAECAVALGKFMREETERTLAEIIENRLIENDQDVLEYHDRVMEPSYNKMIFTMEHVITPIMNHDQWVTQREKVCQECIYGFIQHIEQLFDSKIKQDEKSLQKTLSYFEGKEYLGGNIKWLWYLLSKTVPTGVVDQQVFIPLLRRLAMRDIVDPGWILVGGWKELLDYCEPDDELPERVPRTPVDDVLDSTTKILQKGRQSQSAQYSLTTIGGSPHYCFQYSPKCSAKMCSNLESAAKPHPFRCRHCFYYHYCSEACLEYCERFVGQHERYCRLVSYEKAEAAEREMKEYFAQTAATVATTTTTTTKSTQHCSSCGISQEHCDLKQCSRCKACWYCSTFCQQWSWTEGGHKTACQARGRQVNGHRTRTFVRSFMLS